MRGLGYGRLTLASAVLLAAAPFGAVGQGEGKEVVWEGKDPAPGIYFYWYEPSFYAGFAPRTQDGSTVHIELSRGNQVRMTMVLGDAELDAYLADLAMRRALVEELVEREVIELSTNRAFERYAAGLEEQDVAGVLAQQSSLKPEAYRTRSAAIMEALNPGRVFRIRLPLSELATAWHRTLVQADAGEPAAEAARLDAINAALPGRINAYAVSDEVADALSAAAAQARAGGPDAPAFIEQTGAFIELASNGRYAVENGDVTALEFTEIMPAGTPSAWTNTPHGRLPDFGVTGVWPLIPREHGRGLAGMVDYLSNNPGYGYIPLLAYQHAGGVYYNAFHNAGIRSPVTTPYLAAEWRNVAGERNAKKPYQQLWVVSRGPASHGCTRMDSGHMSQMRHALPSASEDLHGIPTFRNLPGCYDVFDIDGDGSSQVMGVQYYLGYKSVKHKPDHAYAPNDRKAYYAWLYGDNIEYQADDGVVVRKVPECRFVGLRKATRARVHESVPLYEAPFAPSPIQFYRIRKVSFETAEGLEFNRELRRVGSGYELDRHKLFLE